MGCPPDPAEVDISRSKDRIEELKTKENDLLNQYKITEKILNELFAKISDSAPFEEQKKVFENRKSYESILIEDYVYNPSGGMYDDVSHWGRQEDKLATHVKLIENSLCELRGALLKIITETGKIFDPAFLKKIDHELELHRIHRLEDRETWLAYLRDLKLQYENKIKHRGPLLEYYEKVKRIDVEIVRVERLSEEEIFHNRSAFGKEIFQE